MLYIKLLEETDFNYLFSLPKPGKLRADGEIPS